MSIEETPRRMTAATLALYQHEERMAQAARSAEPSVSVECDDTAKGDTTPTVKLYAPLGCDLEALEAHAAKVTEIAVRAALHRGTRRAGNDSRPFTDAEVDYWILSVVRYAREFGMTKRLLAALERERPLARYAARQREAVSPHNETGS